MITKIELGCGNNKTRGFYGIDIIKTDSVDLVLDFEKNPLPFPDNSIEEIYSSHAFEHINSPQGILMEMIRVCKPNARIEIWTPYGKSDDGMLFGHHIFYSETSFKHICFEYDRFYLGESNGYFNWKSTQYNLHPDILERLEELNISLNFALTHMFNIALEWGVVLEVIKGDANIRANGPQYPQKYYSVAGRGGAKIFE